MSFTIRYLHAREVFDSRGNPTIEVDIKANGCFARAMVPSGASTGVHEAVEVRDGGSRLMGKGVLKAVKNVNDIISKKIVGMDCTQQRDIDNLMIELDGTDNKSKLGANAILGVSIACCKVAAKCLEKPLYSYIAELANVEKFVMPVPSFNVINGGKHAGNKLDIQEYMILPVGAKSFVEAMQLGVEVYHTLKNIIKERYGVDATNVGDEGGFAPPLNSVEEPIRLLSEAITVAGYEDKIKLGIDAAASEFYNNLQYTLDGRKLSGDELIALYKQLIEHHPIISFEDPFAEDDFDSFAKFTADVCSNIQVVSDDLLDTNVKRIE